MIIPASENLNRSIVLTEQNGILKQNDVRTTTVAQVSSDKKDEFYTRLPRAASPLFIMGTFNTMEAINIDLAWHQD